MEKILISVINFVTGDFRFKGRPMKRKVRFYWRCVTFGVLFLLFVCFILIPLTDFMSRMSSAINDVYWYGR